MIRRLKDEHRKVAVTSIGIDGEMVDQVTQSSKPEITLHEGMVFTTSEKHYSERRLTSEILHVSRQRTAMGRLVTARTIIPGKIILSGPSDTVSLQRLLKQHNDLDVDVTLVDGALSRMSLASPTVTQAMVLATGAAYSANMAQLIKQTKFMADLISLSALEVDFDQMPADYDKGIFAIDNKGAWLPLDIPSALMFEKYKEHLLSSSRMIYVGGVVSDKFLKYLTLQLQQGAITVVVRDFTKLFITPYQYHAFLKMGGVLKVLFKTQLIAVTVNPTSPQGYRLDNRELCEGLSEALKLPVYNVKQLEM